MPVIPTAQRITQLRPTAVNAIQAEVREFQDRGGQPVSLMRGQPDFATPAHIIEAVNRALANGRTNYPNNQGEPDLRNAVARKLATVGAGTYNADEEILITTGATLGVYAAIAAVVNPGDEVLIPEPIYDAYLSVIALVGGIAHSVPATIVDGRFTLAADAVAAACGPRTVALLLNSPWNPTGTVLRRDELAALMDVTADRNLAVISDEIYEKIVYDGCQHVSPATLSADARERTIVVNSLSKTYAMTGWRLGYCAGPAELIRAMYLVLQQSSRGPATFVQDAGIAALDGSQDCVTAMIAEYATRRRLVIDALSDIPRINVLVPEGGFFAMLDTRELGLPSDELRRRLLTENEVVVMHGGAYGHAAEGTLRVAFATGGENLQAGLGRLREGLKEVAAAN